MESISRKADYDKAKRAALDLLQRYSYTDPPISPFEVAAYLGLAVKEIVMPSEYRNVSGFIDLKEKVIFVNKEDPVNRRAFTVAHEVGHYLLHRDEILSDRYAYQFLYRDATLSSDVTLEKEANYFAANLLVPSVMLERFKSYSAALLAKLFIVSQEVINYRLQDLEKGIWNKGSKNLPMV